jgi:CheY-like chemotaxis protein
VRDQGAGIRGADLAHLFETFRQLDSSMARHHEGSGLGLALVSRMANLHGGTVGVASAEGQGSQFSIWLPRRLADNTPAAAADDPPPQRVLVVEDDKQAAQLLRLHFESLGFEVQLAGDAASALERAELGSPDLVTLDLLLPGASGWELLKTFKAHPRLAQIPIIIISIMADEARARALGAAGLLQKPIAHAALLDAVNALGLGSGAAPVLSPPTL